MNIKKIICIILVSISTIVPIKAKEARHIIILSEDLPYIIYADIASNASITMHFIPIDITIPIPCASNLAVPLSSILSEENKDCVKDAVENFFNINIQHTIYLHMDKISEATGISMHA